MSKADELIKNMESDAVKFLTAKALAGLTANVWSGFSGFLVGGLAGQLIGWVISVGITYGDWLSYMLITGWQTTKEAEHYEEKAEARASLPKSASKEEKARAEKAQKEAFDRLVSLGGPN